MDDIIIRYEKATDYFYKNDYENALKIYKEIVEKDPKHIPSLEKIAKIFIQKGDITGGIEYYERILKIDNKNAKLWNEVGNHYFDLEKFDEAINCYKKAIDADSSFYWGYYNLGLALTRKYPATDKKRMDEAKSYFDKVLEINSDYYPVYNEIGLYYMNNNEIDKALTNFNKCININPQYKYPYYNIATIYKNKQDYKKAKEYLLKAVKLDPDWVSANNNLGITYYYEGNYQNAIYYYLKAMLLDKNYKYAPFNIGLCFFQLEKYRKAYEMYKKAIEIDPNYTVALEEIKILEKDYPEEIKKQEGLKEEDLKLETYSKNLEESNLDINNQTSVNKERSGEEKTNIDNTNQTEETTELFCEKFGRNLTKLAKKGKLYEVIGRDKEIKEILEILYQIKKNNPLIIGKAGVGKTAVVEGVAIKIAKGEVPDFFKQFEIIELNIGSIVAGTTYRGDFEKRIQRIIDEVKENEHIILFLDEIHTILGAGSTSDGALDASNMLKPALARGELRCIGATTLDEYYKYFQKDPAFERRFYTVMINELSPEATFEILKNLKNKMVSHYKINITEENLKLIVELAKEEIKNRCFPDKAIDILEKAFSRSSLEGKQEVDDQTIRNIVGEFVGIKFLETEKDRGKHLLDMEIFLKERIYGQDEAISKISNVIRMTKSKLDLKPEQPDGVFLFVGSSGTGKTYLAKLIAEFLFGNQSKLITLNMSEFSEPHSVSKLIGSPPGYVGFENPSFFTSTILPNPSCVLLLDELEKAHPEVLKLFLQIFDEGKVTDTKGKVIHFSNVTIIMTSNVITSNSSVGFANNTIKADVKLTDFFPPEFINRIDEVIIFNPITKDIARKILTDLIIEKAKKVFEKRGINISFSPSFVDYIIEKGYSQTFGVRNLERVFEKETMSVVTNYILSNSNITNIQLTFENGVIKILN